MIEYCTFDDLMSLPKVNHRPETPVDPGAAPETPVDPGAAPETPVDPGAAPETPIDPGAAPETPVDPGATSTKSSGQTTFDSTTYVTDQKQNSEINHSSELINFVDYQSLLLFPDYAQDKYESISAESTPHNFQLSDISDDDTGIDEEEEYFSKLIQDDKQYDHEDNKVEEEVYCSFSSNSGRLSDEELKELAFLTSMGYSQCTSRNCPNKRDCRSTVTMADIAELKKWFWNPSGIPAPTSKERRMKLIKLVESSYIKHSGELLYSIPVKNTNGKIEVPVCEEFYLLALGIGRSFQWRQAKAAVKNGAEYDTTTIVKRVGSSPKFNHALAFITTFAESQCDPLPTIEGDIAEGEAVRCVPFETKSAFYEEYLEEGKRYGTPSSLIAGRNTFSVAFCSRKNIRLMRAKGNFSCCEICANATQLLQDPRRLGSSVARSIVKTYRSHHLKQQLAERVNLEERIQQCRERDPVTGQPKSFLILPDGMTASKGSTPKFYKGHISTAKDKGKDKFESRIIGVYVVCGHIEGMFLYTTNNLYSSGANTMIEVMRQASMDLQVMLNADGYRLPKIMCLQFDNCGENKNKYMFVYLSLMIEMNFFDQIKVSFLIVGHTYCVVDQYFSTLSQKIKDCSFIGTPLALNNLFLQKKSEVSTYRPPLLQKNIDVIYDFSTAFEPYINNKLKYYQAPHEFLFTRLMDKCICQYKLYSTDPVYLPQPPHAGAPRAEDMVQGCIIPPLAPIGNPSEFLQSVDIPLSLAEMNPEGVTIARANTFIQGAFAAINQIELLSDGQQRQRMENEANLSSVRNKRNPTPAERDKLIQQQIKLRKECTETHGFIVWLEARANLPDYRSIVVKPYDPSKFVDKANTIHGVAVSLLQDVITKRVGESNTNKFVYHRPELCIEEMQFLEKLRDNPLYPLLPLKLAYENYEDDRYKWKPFIRIEPILTEEHLNRNENYRIQNIEGHVLCELNLQKSSLQGFLPGAEIIAREGNINPRDRNAGLLQGNNIDPARKEIFDRLEEIKKASADHAAQAKARKKALKEAALLKNSPLPNGSHQLINAYSDTPIEPLDDGTAAQTIPSTIDEVNIPLNEVTTSTTITSKTKKTRKPLQKIPKSLPYGTVARNVPVPSASVNVTTVNATTTTATTSSTIPAIVPTLNATNTTTTASTPGLVPAVNGTSTTTSAPAIVPTLNATTTTATTSTGTPGLVPTVNATTVTTAPVPIVNVTTTIPAIVPTLNATTTTTASTPGLVPAVNGTSTTTSAPAIVPTLNATTTTATTSTGTPGLVPTVNATTVTTAPVPIVNVTTTIPAIVPTLNATTTTTASTPGLVPAVNGTSTTTSAPAIVPTLNATTTTATTSTGTPGLVPTVNAPTVTTAPVPIVNVTTTIPAIVPTLNATTTTTASTPGLVPAVNGTSTTTAPAIVPTLNATTTTATTSTGTPGLVPTVNAPTVTTAPVPIVNVTTTIPAIVPTLNATTASTPGLVPAGITPAPTTTILLYNDQLLLDPRQSTMSNTNMSSNRLDTANDDLRNRKRKFDNCICKCAGTCKSNCEVHLNAAVGSQSNISARSSRRGSIIPQHCQCGFSCGHVSDDLRKCTSKSCTSMIVSMCYYLKCSKC